MRIEQAKHLKELEQENTHLKRLVIDLFLDNGSEFTAKAIRNWLNRLGVKTLHIELDSSWENGYIESLNGKLRDEKRITRTDS